MSKRVINTANVAIPFDAEFTVEEFNDFLLKKASEAREKHSGLNAKVLNFKFWEEQFYDDYTSGIVFTIERDESPAEEAKRLKLAENAQIRREKAKQRSLDAKAKAEAEELLLYNKLKAKYEK